MHAQSEAVQEALAAQLAAVGLHPAVHLPVGGEGEKRERTEHQNTVRGDKTSNKGTKENVKTSNGDRFLSH